MNRLLLIALFFEIGIVLVIVPWSEYWERNYFGTLLPFVHTFMTNHFVRGAVSGLGVLNLLAGISEALSLVLARRSQEVPSVTQPRANEE